MNRDERQGLIAALQQRNAADRASLAARIAEREARGEYFDVTPTQQRSAPATIRKINENALQPPQQQFGEEADPLLFLADEVGTITGRLERELTALRKRFDMMEDLFERTMRGRDVT
jgi:hypothetical protein